MVEKVSASALPSGSHDRLFSAVYGGLDIVLWAPVSGSIEIAALTLPSACSKIVATIAFPSGDQAESDATLAIGPARMLFSLLPSEFAMMRWYLPGSGSLARMKAKRRPSEEKLGFVSISLTRSCGVPPSTGMRYRSYS